MKKGARLQAAVILIEKILASQSPADSVITGYFRQCRYMGSTDRRVISTIVYQILRRFEELAWYLKEIPPKSPELSRLLVLTYAHKLEHLSISEIETLCPKQGLDDKFGLEPLTTFERLLLTDMTSLKPKDMPLNVQLNIPLWLLPQLENAFGEQLEDAIKALNQEAPFDLRVNSLKTTREAVLKQLTSEGFKAVPTPWSLFGVRLDERRPLSGHPLWKNGEIEVQDEGSQLLALLTDAKPGMAVIDFCAGAGGKTLALAATMKNSGRIVATDIANWRLTRARQRLRKAGVNNVELRDLADDGIQKWLKRQLGRFDRVLVDAPCSGSGTWRRNPDIKRRFTKKDFNEIIVKQQEILSRAAPLTKPGGRLIYATCSVFQEENNYQITKFLETHPNFQLIPISSIWESMLDTPCPIRKDTLQLMPHLHNVDGFFIAVMERKQ